MPIISPLLLYLFRGTHSAPWLHHSHSDQASETLVSRGCRCYVNLKGTAGFGQEFCGVHQRGILGPPHLYTKSLLISSAHTKARHGNNTGTDARQRHFISVLTIGFIYSFRTSQHCSRGLQNLARRRDILSSYNHDNVMSGSRTI